MNHDSTKSSVEQALMRLYRRCASEIPAAAIDALILAAAQRPMFAARPSSSADLRLPFALAASLMAGLGLMLHFDREAPFVPKMLPAEAMALWPGAGESAGGLGLDSIDAGYRDAYVASMAVSLQTIGHVFPEQDNVAVETETVPTKNPPVAVNIQSASAAPAGTPIATP